MKVERFINNEYIEGEIPPLCVKNRAIYGILRDFSLDNWHKTRSTEKIS